MDVLTLDQIECLLQESPAEIFADIGKEGAPEERHRTLARGCHPDKFPGDAAQQERATHIFQRLESAWVEFQKPPVVYQSPNHHYTLFKPLGDGDVSLVWLAGREDGGKTVLKISRVRQANKYLEQESRVLADLFQQAGDRQYREYLPMPLEDFEGADRLRIAVQNFRPGFFTAQEILGRYPQGVEPRHIAWMFKRVLTVLGFVHRANYIHAALTPAHVLFHAENHGCQLLSWIHVVRNGQPLGVIPTAYQDRYPEAERKHKAPVGVGMDLYLAAKLMLRLAGEQVLPPQLSSFLSSFLLADPASRAVDAWQCLEEWDQLLLRLFGKPCYIRLAM